MFISSKTNPEKACYILSDANKLGWYCKDSVYFFEYDPETKGIRARRKKLSEWCDRYIELVKICDKEKYIEAGGTMSVSIWE